MSGIVVEKIGTLTGHRDSIYVLEQGAEDRYFYSAGGDGLVVLWDLQNPADGVMVAKVTKSVYALRYFPVDNTMLVGENFEGLHLIDLSKKKEAVSSQFTDAAIFDLAISGNRIYVAGGDGTLSVLQYPDLSTIAKLHFSDFSLRSLSISANKQHLAIGSSDHTIRILSIPDLKEIKKINEHTNSVFTARYSPDGRYLLTAGRDAHLKIWSVAQGYSLQQSIVAHMYAINHLEYSPDAKYFATCSMDKSIKIWDAETFRLLKVIDKSRHAGHGTSVNKLLWSKYEDSLISASDDRSISIWNIHFNTLQS